MRMFTRGRLVPRQPWAIKRTTRTELRDETIVKVTWLIIKDKMIWGKLRKETILLMVQNRSFHKTNNINVAQET